MDIERNAFNRFVIVLAIIFLGVVVTQQLAVVQVNSTIHISQEEVKAVKAGIVRNQALLDELQRLAKTRWSIVDHDKFVEDLKRLNPTLVLPPPEEAKTKE